MNNEQGITNFEVKHSVHHSIIPCSVFDILFVISWKHEVFNYIWFAHNQKKPDKLIFVRLSGDSAEARTRDPPDLRVGMLYPLSQNKKSPTILSLSGFPVILPRLELGTLCLKGRCSTSWATESFFGGAKVYDFFYLTKTFLIFFIIYLLDSIFLIYKFLNML